MKRDIVRDVLFLRQPSVEATRSDVAVGRDLLDTLIATRDRCVGLAANMIGVKKRVIVIMLGQMPLVMFNPRVEAKSGPYQTEEGCLSLDGSRATQRYESLTVTYTDLDWVTKTITLTGFAAQICQHELDHLEGILI